MFCLCKSLSYPFLEPTSTKQCGNMFLLNETNVACEVAHLNTHYYSVSAKHMIQRTKVYRKLTPLFINWKWVSSQH